MNIESNQSLTAIIAKSLSGAALAAASFVPSQALSQDANIKAADEFIQRIASEKQTMSHSDAVILGKAAKEAFPHLPSSKQTQVMDAVDNYLGARASLMWRTGVTLDRPMVFHSALTGEARKQLDYEVGFGSYWLNRDTKQEAFLAPWAPYSNLRKTLLSNNQKWEALINCKPDNIVRATRENLRSGKLDDAYFIKLPRDTLGSQSIEFFEDAKYLIKNQDGSVSDLTPINHYRAHLDESMKAAGRNENFPGAFASQYAGFLGHKVSPVSFGSLQGVTVQSKGGPVTNEKGSIVPGFNNVAATYTFKQPDGTLATFHMNTAQELKDKNYDTNNARIAQLNNPSFVPYGCGVSRVK